MVVKVDLSDKTLTVDNKKFFISCVVRNELNGWRKKSQVVKSIPKDRPIYPRPFPKGAWKISGVEYSDDPVYAPVKIKTNAFKMLPIWKLDDKCNYESKTAEYTRDEAYWLHYADGSTTTLGCIRLNSPADAIALAKIIETELETSCYVKLEVV